MTLTVQEFEQKLTLRVLLGKIYRSGRKPDYQTLFSSAFYTLNEILRDEGLGATAWAIRRGKRLYILHAETRRIICEVGVLENPPGFRLVTLRGMVHPTETLQGLIQATAARGVRRKNVNVQRKEQK